MLSSLQTELAEEPHALSRMLRDSWGRLPKGSILIGAGDCYAAALCASQLSPTGSRAMDPYELIVAPEIARSRTVVFLSVSGRTRSNLAAARRVGKIAAGTLAITAVEDSPLAKAVTRTILIPHAYSPRTPGLASFVLTLAACAKLLVPRLSVDPARAFSAGGRESRRLGLSGRGTTFFVGNGPLYAVSIYAAAKLHELFGAKAAPQRLEEFSHMDLFSLKRRDVVNIYGGFDPLDLGVRLAKSLKKAGYLSHLASSRASNQAECVFAQVFATQFSVLRWARRMRLSEPHFSTARWELAVSDSMIY